MAPACSHAAIVAGPGEGPPRLAAHPDGLLACLGCLAEDRHQLQAVDNSRNAASDKTFMQDRTTEWPTRTDED
jgi:hypothetical protein